VTVAVVVGYGSIGRRHVSLLQQLGCETSVVSRREIDDVQRYPSLEAALKAAKPDYVVVANETSAHGSTVREWAKLGYKGRLLIEKPLGDDFVLADPLPFSVAAVGYNLRFHPVMAELSRKLPGEKLLAMQVYCGQYLPDWRPGSDYRLSYSADPARGGGVLRDLSHELDYLLWLGGAWRRAAAIGGHFSPLEIRSDDCWTILLELERCPAASVQINYLDRPGRRQVVVNTAQHTFCADLIRATLTVDGKEQSFALERDAMYLAEHRAMLDGDTSRLCSLREGQQVMQLIAASERAARDRSWVSA